MQDEVLSLVGELIEEEMTLRDLRQVQHLKQKRVADILGIEQDSYPNMTSTTLGKSLLTLSTSACAEEGTTKTGIPKL